MKIRGHHVFCLLLFAGAGYSKGFTKQLGQIAGQLKNNPDEMVEIIQEADDICVACPNLQDHVTCLLCNQDVLAKDRQILNLLALDVNTQYSFGDILAQVAQVEAADFLSVCGTCRWYQQGLCTYAALEKEVTRLLQPEQLL